MGVKLSYSKISTYTNCPRQYFLSYVCNLGTGSSVYMSNGSAIHKACEDFVSFGTDEYSEILENKFSNISETSQKSLENLISYYYKVLPKIDKDNLIHEVIDGEIIVNPVFEEKAIKSLTSFYEDYMENKYQQKESGRYAFHGPNRENNKPNIILQEQWFNIKTKDGHEIRGLIDRVDVEPEGEHIIDYKTGQSRVTYNALKDPLDIKSLQLSIYALARYKETGKIPYKSSFFYLEPAKNKKVQKGEYRSAPKRDIEQLERLEDYLNSIGNEIEAATINKDFPMGDSPNCYFCEFKDNCEILSEQQLAELNNKIEINSSKKKVKIDNSMWNED